MPLVAHALAARLPARIVTWWSSSCSGCTWRRRPMLRRLAIVALVIIGVVISPPSPAPTHAASPTKVTIALNWIKNVEFGGLWIAQEKGWWANAGIQIATRGYDFTNDP